MKACRWLVVMAVAGMCCSAMAQADAKQPAKPADAKKPAAQPSEEEMMKAYEAAAKVGPQHEQLKQFLGTWNAKIVSQYDPSAAATEETGTMTNTLIMDGRFLKHDYTGTMMGQPFTGLGLWGYDNIKKEYIGIWADSMSTNWMTTKGQFDAATKSWTMRGTMTQPDGKDLPTREVIRVVDANSHVMEFYHPGPDGKEVKMMTITYTRAGGAPAARPAPGR